MMVRSIIALVLFAAFAFAQTTLPTLPAVTVITTATESCQFEAQDQAGGLFVQCKTLADGSVAYTSVSVPSDDGAIVGHGSVMCLYWTEATDKWRLQCADGSALKVDGYVPKITRKKRWYLLWR